MFLCFGVVYVVGILAVIYVSYKWSQQIHKQFQNTPPDDQDDGIEPADLVILDCLLHGDDPFDN